MEESDKQNLEGLLVNDETTIESTREENGRKFQLNTFNLSDNSIEIVLIGSIELSNLVNSNINNSDSGISPNDSEVEALINDGKFYDEN